jgi:hypothetical protein
MMHFDWPFCAKCGHGVEKVERRQDYFTGDVIYTVHCHGQKESQIVSELDTHDATLIWATAASNGNP